MKETDDRKFAKVIAKACTDEDFKEHLKADPRKALASMGIEVPSDGTIEIVESDDNRRFFVLPPPPDNIRSPEAFQDSTKNMDFRSLVHVFYNVSCC